MKKLFLLPAMLASLRAAAQTPDSIDAPWHVVIDSVYGNLNYNEVTSGLLLNVAYPLINVERFRVSG